MQGTIVEIGLSKTGKPKVKVDNQWYSIKTTEGFTPGRKIDFEAHEFQFNGKLFWGIDKFALLPPATAAYNGVHAAPQAAAPSKAPAQPMQAAEAQYSEPERMFVSNIVAAAINAGAVKSPVDLISWCNGALTALRNVKVVQPKPRDEFDDDVEAF